MNPISKEVNGQIEDVCRQVTEALKPHGFGILTRIDFDQKIKEKLGETTRPCVILGACNPRLAFEAYKQSTDTALLIPCNIAVTEIREGVIKVEAMRPTEMLKILPKVDGGEAIAKADQALEAALSHL